MNTGPKYTLLLKHNEYDQSKYCERHEIWLSNIYSVQLLLMFRHRFTFSFHWMIQSRLSQQESICKSVVSQSIWIWCDRHVGVGGARQNDLYSNLRPDPGAEPSVFFHHMMVKVHDRWMIDVNVPPLVWDQFHRTALNERLRRGKAASYLTPSCCWCQLFCSGHGSFRQGVSTLPRKQNSHLSKLQLQRREEERGNKNTEKLFFQLSVLLISTSTVGV